MDIIERFHNKFGRWYEKLFNEEGSQALRPKDVLRKILDAMEQHRSEGFDGKVYVPNKYILELAVADADERDYLLSFLDEDELSAVLRRYMAQNAYSTRGPLDFTIVDVDPAESESKLNVKVRFEKGAIEPPIQPVASTSVGPSSSLIAETDDLLTIAAVPQTDYEDDDLMTIAAVPTAWAALVVIAQDGRRSLITISKSEFAIGRARQGGNDLVLFNDGQVSKRHARIERETDGQATIYDLGSTNGVLVNGKSIPGNLTLRDGDEILIGTTTLVFQYDAGDKNQSSEASDIADSAALATPANLKRARLIPESGGTPYPLASETLIGKAVTCDIVLSDAASSTRQAQVIAPDISRYFLQDLAGHETTKVNGRALHTEERIRLADGDIVEFGQSRFQFSLPGAVV